MWSFLIALKIADGRNAATTRDRRSLSMTLRSITGNGRKEKAKRRTVPEKDTDGWVRRRGGERERERERGAPRRLASAGRAGGQLHAPGSPLVLFAFLQMSLLLFAGSDECDVSLFAEGGCRCRRRCFSLSRFFSFSG